jgi:hypothetical protein
MAPARCSIASTLMCSIGTGDGRHLKGPQGQPDPAARLHGAQQGLVVVDYHAALVAEGGDPYDPSRTVDGFTLARPV